MNVTTIGIVGHRVEKHPVRVVFKKNIQGTHVIPGVVAYKPYKPVGQKNRIIGTHSYPEGHKTNYRNCQSIRPAGFDFIFE